MHRAPVTPRYVVRRIAPPTVSDPMRLVHVIASLDPAQGGPPVVAARLGAAQRERGHQVEVLGYGTEEGRPRVESMLASTPQPGPQALHLLTAGSKWERLRAQRASDWLKEHLSGVDLLHLHGVWDPILHAAARAAKRQGIPWIVTPHGMLDPWSMTQSRLKKKIALRGWVGPTILDGARFIHALNKDEIQGMAPLVRSTPMEVVPNGVFIEELTPPAETGAFRKSSPFLGGDPYVFFLSRLHYKKGLDVLVDAFNKAQKCCPSARLVIAGPDDGYEATVRGLIAESPARDRIHLVGPLYGDAKRNALIEANCFCLPSRQEGFSIAITEALGFGTPVVITDACHFPEVESAGAGHVVDLNGDAVAAALVDTLQDQDARDDMGASGARLVRKDYTWPSIAARFDELFGEYECSYSKSEATKNMAE